MDGHFVPNLTIGPPVVAALKRADAAARRAPDDRGARSVRRRLCRGRGVVAVRARRGHRHLQRTSRRIQQLGAQAGVVINPATPVDALVEVAADVDFVLVMSVNPGFGGQSFIARSLRPAAASPCAAGRTGSPAVESRWRRRPDPGGAVVAAGATILVAGAAVFAAPDPAAATPRCVRRAAVAGRPARPDERRLRKRPHPGALRRDRPDGCGLPRATTSCGSKWAGWNCCGSSAGPTRRSRRAACFLPVIEATCQYRHPARYDDEFEIRTTGRWRAPCGWSSRMSWSGGRRACAGRWPHPARTHQSRRAAVPAAGDAQGDVRMRALVTGAAGFIGSTPDRGACLGRGADVVGIDCFTDYYPRALKERNLAAARHAPAVHVRRGDLLERRPRRPARRRDARLPPGGPGRRAQELGTGLPASTSATTSTATQRLLEACAGRPLDRFVYASSSSVYGDEAAMPMREDALLQPLSPYGVSKLAAEQLCHLYHVNYGVPDGVAAVLHGVRPPATAGHGLSTGSCRAVMRRAADRASTATASRRGTSRTWPTSSAATVAAGDAGRAWRRLQHRWRLARHGEPGARHHRAARRPARDPRAAAAQKGDMRDTYADTTPGARRTSGSRPRSPSNRDWRPSTMATEAQTSMSRIEWACPRSRSSRSMTALLVLAACADNAEQASPTGVTEPDKYLFERGQGGARRAASGSPPASTSGSSSTATRRAPSGPTPSSASATPTSARVHRGQAASRSNEFREFLYLLSDARRAPTTRSSSWRWRTSRRCRRPSATRRDTQAALDRVRDVRRTRYPEQPADARRRREGYREARDRLSESNYRVGLLLPQPRWYPGAHRAVPAAC